MPGGNVATEEELAAVAAKVAKDADPEPKVDADVDPPSPDADPGDAQPDPAIVAAQKAGWKDKAAWVADGKDPDEWVPARVFNKNGELYQSIRETKKTLQEQRALTEAALAENRRLAEIVRKREVAAKERERDAAIESGDKDAVKRIDGEIQQIDKALAPNAAPPANPEAEAWIAGRAWLRDPALQKVAAAMHQEQIDAKDTRPLLELFAEVETRVKAAYPHKFPKDEPKVEPKTDDQPRRLSAVEAPGVRQTVTKRAGKSWSDLPETAKSVGREYIKRGVFKSHDEYAADYFKLNGA